MHIVIGYLIIFVFSKNFCVSRKYNNYTLYRVVPVNETHLEFISYLNEYFDVIFWREPTVLYKPAEFVINPNDELLFLQHAQELGIYITTIIKDVQPAFDEQTASVKKYIRRKMSSMGWTGYYRLEDIYNWMTDLSKAYPKEVSVRSIGDSHERRPILVLRVLLIGSLARSTVIVEGGIHAREWISSAFVTYLISQVIHGPSSGDSSLKRMAETYEFYFIPVLNPDGYEYTHKTDRLWRKNRNGAGGVDLNRNFASAFGTAGISWSKLSERYCGPHAFSERESKALADFVQSKSQNLEYYISFHSYGQYIVIPYGYNKRHVDNYKEMHEICTDMMRKISGKYQTQYDCGTAFETVGYLASGLSTDWVKRTFKVPYVTTLELRDNGQYGFALPPSQILSTCIETLDGVVSLLTPRGNMTRYHNLYSSTAYNILDRIVVVFNVILFIIVRFD